MTSLPSVGIVASTLVSAAGLNVESLWQRLLQQQTGLSPQALNWCDLPVWTGPVAGVDDVTLPDSLKTLDCRNHRLAWMALQDHAFRSAIDQQIARTSASRIGLVLATSTSGIRSTEIAYSYRKSHGSWPVEFNYRHTHSVNALARFVAKTVGITGPAVTIVAACASSAKVFLLAQRWISAGLVDAVVVGGVDSLCLSTLLGFNALQLLSEDICRPFDAQRCGISLGEAAGFVLLSRDHTAIRFLGGGESSDAWNMTTPHPEGLGAREAMTDALKATGLQPSDIGYVNAHGTASRSNDRAEAIALGSVFGDFGVPMSATKGVTGHTLGAAGIVEAIITIEALARGTLPPTANLDVVDPELKVALVNQAQEAQFNYAMSNNFGFGGANCSLVFGRGA